MITPDRIELAFAAELNALSRGKQLRDGLSVAAQIGTTLWVGNDESLSLERLTLLLGSHSIKRKQSKLEDGGAASALLVVYDGASERRKPREHCVIADVFPLA